MKDLSEMMLHIQNEIQIAAPAAVVWESLMEQMGPGFEGPDGKTMHFQFEPWVGGRWYRDLGNKSGHLWGFVQVIKPHALLEITGPLMMSYPALNHVQYRLTADGAGTKLSFNHRGMGDIPPDHRTGMIKGWGDILAAIKARVRI